MKNKVTKISKQSEQPLQRPQSRKISEYGKQLYEKQKVKQMYGMREQQFVRFFNMAVREEGDPGENLLSLLERRLDNVVYRLKMAKSRKQARQIVVHRHILVNKKTVYSPSFLVSPEDEIVVSKRTTGKEKFLQNVIDKRIKMAIKVPAWLEFNKEKRKGTVLRSPVRSDVQAPIEEHLIIELYSK